MNTSASENGQQNPLYLGNPQARAKVLRTLQEWKIPYALYEHPPLPTIEEALEYWKDIQGTHCKNLFFRNHKGDKHYLIIFECHQQMAIHDIEKRLRQGKMSFASQQRMEKYLGLKPGSVSVFGLINDTNKEVKLFLDENLRNADLISFHPNDNTASLLIKNQDLHRFLQHWGGEWEYIKLYE